MHLHSLDKYIYTFYFIWYESLFPVCLQHIIEGNIILFTPLYLFDDFSH